MPRSRLNYQCYRPARVTLPRFSYVSRPSLRVFSISFLDFHRCTSTAFVLIFTNYHDLLPTTRSR